MASEGSKRSNKLALSSDRALGLLLIAEKYGHDKMKSVCQGFLENDLTAENCCSVYLAACKSENKILQSSAAKFIHKNALEVVRTDGWNQCLDEDPKFAESIYDEVMNTEFLSVDQEINRSKMAVEKLKVKYKFSNPSDSSLSLESGSENGTPELN